MSDYRRWIARTVLVKAGDEQWTGVLDRETDRVLVLVDAEMVLDGADPVPADGELVIERRIVDWVQVV